MRILIACCKVLPLVLASTAFAQTQDFPNRPLRILATEVGGGADLVARIVANALREPLGQQVIVENRGATLIAIDIVTKAPPDGYTLFLGGVSVFMDPLLRPVPYDPFRDFSPICVVATSPGVLVVSL